jgi:hypothetical protein
MIGDQQNCQDHPKFKELSALAGAGTLTPRELSKLNAHLESCEKCRTIARQYLILKTQGIPTLAATYSERQEQRSWDEASTRQKLFARVRVDQQPRFEANNGRSVAARPHLLRRVAVNPFAQTIVAACLVITVGFGAYGLGLRAQNREQEHRLENTEQYLTSDRDIRELMEARKLYIADIFDVDGGSRTRKPFGRVFYTQGKSLIFYAFDLDRQSGIVNANTFQVWGQKETPQGEQALPMNLGILYMDNESNRRWVMRFDDPRRLAEIDAIFVTVEPHGGSQKPTSKPFLYALLRNEVNHP